MNIFYPSRGRRFFYDYKREKTKKAATHGVVLRPLEHHEREARRFCWWGMRGEIDLHIFRNGDRPISQHVHIAAHLIVIPAIDHGLGDGNIDGGAS